MSRWPQLTLTDRGLPAATLTAYREAGNRRLETWAAEVGSHPCESDSTPHATFKEGSTGLGPSDESSYESIRRLWSLLQDATDRLDDVVREAAARRLSVVTGRDPGEHVTAFLTGSGELTDLALDEAWAAEAGNGEIGTALTAAIIDGYTAVDQRARESASQWPFPDLDLLSGAPATLLATLGLPPVASDNNSRQE